MAGWVVPWAVGIGLLSAAGSLELRNRRLGPNAPPIWRQASVVIGLIGALDVIVAIVLWVAGQVA